MRAFSWKNCNSKIKSYHFSYKMPDFCDANCDHARKSFCLSNASDVPEYAEYLKTCDFDSVFIGTKDFFKFEKYA